MRTSIPKTCLSCGREFRNSAHKKCSGCRKRSKGKVCACGTPILNISIQCYPCASSLSGPANPRWRDGKTKHKKGYIQRRVPEHPRTCASNPYVFEHILVMEEVLGRHLEKHENIHHKNGVRDDNRVENLELWSRFQPAGQRVSDKVAWAVEMLKLYSPELLK